MTAGDGRIGAGASTASVGAAPWGTGIVAAMMSADSVTSIGVPASQREAVLVSKKAGDVPCKTLERISDVGPSADRGNVDRFLSGSHFGE